MFLIGLLIFIQTLLSWPWIIESKTRISEQSKTVTKSPILDELYALKAENDKPIEEEIKIKLEPISQPVKIAPKPICKLDDMINSNSTRDYRLKRQTNNQAASRSRAKKKRLIQERSEKNDRFERDNPELKKTLNKYEGELHGLKRKLDFYEQRLGTVKWYEQYKQFWVWEKKNIEKI